MTDSALPVFRTILLADIIFPPEEMRTGVSFEGLDELARSLRSQGLMNPISVRRVKDKYELIAGYRRIKAAEINGWTEIDAKVYDTSVDSALLKKAHENIFREEVNPYDEANYFKIILEKQNWKLEDLAVTMHKSTSYIRRRMELLNMPAILAESVKDGKINLSIAEELARIKNSTEMERLLYFIISNGATVETVRQWRIQYEMSNNVPPPAYADGSKLGADGNPVDMTKPFDLSQDTGPMAEINESVKMFRICHACLKKTDADVAKLLILCPDCESQISKSLQGIK